MLSSRLGDVDDDGIIYTCRTICFCFHYLHDSNLCPHLGGYTESISISVPLSPPVNILKSFVVVGSLREI